jgi:hypothetical protein
VDVLRGIRVGCDRAQGGRLVNAPAVTVVLPVFRADDCFPAAFRCVAAQTLRDIDIVIVLNGADAATARMVRGLASGEPRARVIEIPEANLAGALNVGLEAARSDLVARMDGDDLCPPARLEIQVARMRSEPSLGALGCAWEIVTPDLRVLSTVWPPTRSDEAGWRLLLGNPFAHGSMMLRRGAVLGAGGYDAACTRAQDYELWLRLSRTAGVAAVPEVLYQHRTRLPLDHSGSTPEQATIAAGAMLGAWNGLPPGDPGVVLPALGAALERGARPGEGLGALEEELTRRPTRDALLSWLYAQWANPPAPRRAIEACRRSRAREVGAALRGDGVAEVWLWGAGDHTRWLLDHQSDLGVAVSGIVDSARAGEVRFGFTVQSPATLRGGQTVLLSSDWHEDAMWEASAAHRARGVRVVRFYAADPSGL